MHRIERAGEPEQSAGEQDRPKIVLEITRGRAKHKIREVRAAAFLIGTAPDCDLVLSDPRFDELHSYVLVSQDRVTIRRLGRGPELRVGGRPVAWASLENLDTLQMGPYEFQVRIEWPPGHVGAGVAGEGPADTLPVTMARDGAIERLLLDVEQYSEQPRLSLFVGDGQYETDRRATRSKPAHRAAWQSSQKKASF
jgi:hypothetical protein